MFKIVQNEKELDANVEGLRKVGELGFSSNTRRYYILVTLGDTRPKIIVPMRDFEGEMQGEGKQKSPDEILPVFHYPAAGRSCCELNNLPTPKTNNCICS